MTARRSRSGRGPAGGFTLIEVLAAVAVLSFAFVGLLATEGVSLRRTLHATRLLEASQAARERMERVLASGEAGLAGDETAGGSPLAVTSSLSETGQEGLTEVRVSVRWKEGESEEAYDLVSYEVR